MAGAATATPGAASMAARVRAERPVSVNAETRRSARPTRPDDHPIDGGVETGVDRERRDQHADADRDAEDGQQAPGRAGDQAPPGIREEAAHGDRYSPSCASRAMSGVAAWSSRRPRTISSRIRPSSSTSTRSA